jgi:RimJ/RimL family protein N-acetyltransferase
MNAFDATAFAPPLRVPRLSCPPVLLRPYAQVDLELVREASSDPLILMTSSVPSVYTDAAGRAFIKRQHERASDGDGYSFVIARQDAEETGLGSIGLWLQEIESGRASIGYWVVESARGKRLAAHALQAVVTFAFDELAIPRLHLFLEPWNVPSARTATAAGFRREATLRGWERVRGAQRDADCYALLHEEWAAGSTGRGTGRPTSPV